MFIAFVSRIKFRKGSELTRILSLPPRKRVKISVGSILELLPVICKSAFLIFIGPSTTSTKSIFISTELASGFTASSAIWQPSIIRGLFFVLRGGGVRIGFLMLKIVNYINFFVILKRLSRNIWSNITQTERDEQIIAFCDKIFLNYF